jgi:pimeloyl-ACP methyl ester carboxylesterase
MIEMKGDLWTYPGDFRVVPTNGVTRNDGTAIMGAGIALQARNRYPDLEAQLGKLILDGGNHVYMLNHGVVAFPTKYHFMNPSDFTLVRQSARELLTLSYGYPDKVFILPRVATGLGGLDWRAVKTLIDSILLSRQFIVVSRTEFTPKPEYEGTAAR